MTWIKICGMTNPEDAQTAVEAGADALGFVFYKKSPRNVAPAIAREIVAKLPAQIEKVGVFVNGFGSDPVDVAREVGLTGIQMSFGFLPAEPVGRLMAAGFAGVPRLPKIFLSLPAAWFFKDAEKVKQFISSLSQEHRETLGEPSFPGGWFDTLFLDSSTIERPGGTGKAFDWVRAAPIAESMQRGGLKLVVAGGLTPINVADAVGILNPWGVDVSSGVEAKPGKKDPDKVRAFIHAIRRIEKN